MSGTALFAMLHFKTKTPLAIAGYLILLTTFFSCAPAAENDPEDSLSLVNPFVGTGGHGHTYPGATAPFGMVQLSPDTRLEGWDGCSGYHYSDSIIYGFSHTHLSGTGVSDYGDILLMPNTGKVQLDNGYKTGVENGYASRFRKETEHASPGYYAVTLEDYNIDVELTASTRVGMHRYSFDQESNHIIIDLEHRDRLLDFSLEQNGANEVIGHRVSSAWAEEQHVYFVAQFSNDISSVEFNDTETVAAFFFDNSKELVVKVGISAVSIQNARENLNSEVPHWDFNRVKEETELVWRNQLKKIEVEGGTAEERQTFYTALYHTMLAPNTWNDVNGQYRGMDMEIHTADHAVYTVFSLWDTFRALHPLFTIIERERTLDFIKTFLLHYEQGGRLPVWELAANETDCMIGYHSVPVVVDAYFKDIDDFDHEKMLAAMVDGAERDHFGLQSYRSNGAILAADEAESVSKTLEYAYDDWCIAQYARVLDEKETSRKFLERAQYYKNLFDPYSRFFRARMDGSWFSPFDPSEVNFNYTEANAWQYSLFVPHDINGLIELHGGESQLKQHLDKLFSASSKTTGRDQADITGLIGQYAHGNEPSHHMAYLYNFTGEPWKTQERVRQIMNEMYSTEPDGLSGNEDCGQMSAWYVFSAMGFYPVTPGLPEYTIGSPLFDRVVINLENGNQLEISTKNNSSEHSFIQYVLHNGSDYPHGFILHDDVISGGSFHFEMGDKPNREWAVEPEFRPKSNLAALPIPAVPFFESWSNTFAANMTVSVGCISPDAKIYVRLNDGEIEPYFEPIILTETTTIESWSVLPGGAQSQRIRSKWHRIDGTRSLSLNVDYANQYSAGGNNALIDFLRGSSNYQTGRWQGYQDQDFEAVIDLGDVEHVNRVAIGFLQDIKSWIWYPREVTFDVSTDNLTFDQVAIVSNSFPIDEYGAFSQDFETPINRKTRYIKISAPNFGPCPDWHMGAGGASWLFADEIVIDQDD